MPSKAQERRLHPRIEHALPLKIAANGYDFATTTENVSCLGAYCNIGKYVPPFTRISVKLNLPIATKKGVKSSKLECNGVIVRSQDDAKGGFNIAIFFNRINQAQKKSLSRYVGQFINPPVVSSKKA
ncbi:MAG: PilZ domain-containing protein [Candidatus Omnitrophica bacterium]|nr:PilZ domain-containing protein [Candidatus Omnitrophota bacterium]